MCKRTKTLKLCTCDFQEISDNFWSYYRTESINNEMIIGEIVAPYNFESQLNNSKTNFIANLLNQKNCFDIELKPQENDSLVLQLELKSGNVKRFNFKFIQNSWVNIEADN